MHKEINKNVVRLKRLDGSGAYRYCDGAWANPEYIQVPKDGHDWSEWREFKFTGKRDYLGFKVYVQIP
jgi:hypothetical protein